MKKEIVFAVIITSVVVYLLLNSDADKTKKQQEIAPVPLPKPLPRPNPYYQPVPELPAPRYQNYGLFGQNCNNYYACLATDNRNFCVDNPIAQALAEDLHTYLTATGTANLDALKYQRLTDLYNASDDVFRCALHRYEWLYRNMETQITAALTALNHPRKDDILNRLSRFKENEYFITAQNQPS